MLSLECLNILSLQHYLVVLALHLGHQACLQLGDKQVVLLFGVGLTPNLEIWGGVTPELHPLSEGTERHRRRLRGISNGGKGLIGGVKGP